MSAKKPKSGSSKRRSRPRPVLLSRQDLDEMARRRCLMILSVLSGERAVTEVIEEAQISRNTYYNLEERALKAMLGALMPGSEAQGAETPAKRIAELEQKLTVLERQKRRGERLLLLTRKVIKTGPVTTTAGRPRSTRAGRRPSTGSIKRKKATATAPPTSMPKPAGEDER